MIDVALSQWRKSSRLDDLVNVAVFGCGGGGIMHTSHYLWHPEVRVRALFDPDASRFADFDVRFPFMERDVMRTQDFRQILERKDIDAVSICTPDHTHAEFAIAALDHGKHVLIEKPMATTLEDCQRIVEASHRSQKVCMVFQQMRFVPRNREVHRLIAEGELGEVIHLETGYVHDMRHRATEFSQWRMDSESFQHPIFGGVHHIDMLRWLGGEVREVFTVATSKGLDSYPAETTYVTTARLANGGTGVVLTCFAPRLPAEFHPLRCYGTRGSVEDTEIVLERPGGFVRRKLEDAEYRGIPQFRNQISHFIDCVRGRAEVDVTPEDATRTVAIAWAAIESAKRRQPVSVPNPLA